jgi:hypothetical protein
MQAINGTTTERASIVMQRIIGKVRYDKDGKGGGQKPPSYAPQFCCHLRSASQMPEISATDATTRLGGDRRTFSLYQRIAQAHQTLQVREHIVHLDGECPFSCYVFRAPNHFADEYCVVPLDGHRTPVRYMNIARYLKNVFCVLPEAT